MNEVVTAYQQNQAALPQKEDGLTLKEKIIFSLVGLGILSGGALIVRKMILNRIANKEEKDTLDEGSVATYAKQIKMAFENDGWPGTNTKELRRIMIEIPNKRDTSRVAKSYYKLYHKSMYADMKDELQSTEYDEMLAIVAEKPAKGGKRAKSVDMNKKYDEWAKRLKAAFEKTYGPFPGTDEDAIKTTFAEIPTQAAFVQVGGHYKALYGTNLIDDLKDESQFGEYSDWMKIITSKPQN
jgi:hypothetical protein